MSISVLLYKIVDRTLLLNECKVIKSTLRFSLERAPYAIGHMICMNKSIYCIRLQHNVRDWTHMYKQGHD